MSWLYSLGAGQWATALGLRAAAALAVAFALSLVIGHYLIRYSRRMGLEEDVSQPDSERLDEMRRAKRGTPTMGGLMVLGAILVAVFAFADVTNFYVWLSCTAMAAAGVLGFFDDLLKLRRGAGAVGAVLSRKMKLGMTFVIGLAVGYLIWRHTVGESSIYGRLFVPLTNHSLALGWVYVVFTAFVVAAVTNAVNLTDGLDGLAAGSSLAAAWVLAIIAYASCSFAVIGFWAKENSDWIKAVSGAGELVILCSALGGALVGFLWYNVHPAQIFMGNVGALAIGAVLAVVTVALKVELLFLLFGVVFVAEAASVLLQVGYFKLTRRRIFRCAPFHHHLEFGGWPETKVTQRLWIASGLGSVAALVVFRYG
jgi:phospho-N-acetylmuramoyl-pentapeptide-transferase